MEEEKRQHRPEFIFLEEEQSSYEQTGERQTRSDYFEQLHRLQSQPFPLSMRFFLWFASVLSLCAMLLAAVFLAANTLFLLATLGLIKPFRMAETRYWRWLRVSAVLCWGLLLAAINPVFGFGVILLYFFTQEETAGSERFRRYLMKRFNL